jgi:hypothetical protein
MESPYESSRQTVPSDAADGDGPGLGPGSSAWRGAKRGARIAAWVSGVIASVLVIPVLAVTAFGLGAGRGFGVSSYFLAGVVVFFFFTGLGALIGAMGGFLRGLRRGRDAKMGAASVKPPPAAGTLGAALEFPSTIGRRRRSPWILGVPVVLLLAAALIVGNYVGRLVDRRLASAIAAADADDPNWRLDARLAHRVQVSDEQNSALVLDKVLQILPDAWPGTRTAIAGESDSSAARVREAFSELGSTPNNVKLGNSVIESFRGELQTYEKAVVLARSLANYSRGRHELKIGRAIFDTPLPHVQGARTATRLLVASCRAIFAAGRSIGDEPFLISHIVRVAIGESALESTRRVLAQGEASDAVLARLEDLMLDEMAQPLLLAGIKGERAILAEIIRRLGAGEIPISALSDRRPLNRQDPPGEVAPWGKLWFDHQRAVAIERMTGAVAIARQPIGRQPALWREWEAEAERLKRSAFGQYTVLLPLLLSPAVATASSAFSRYHTDLAANAILVAAERHRRKTGQWPASVAAIDRTIIPSAPADPYSGESFRMEHRDGRLFVYSVGPNGVDEHGEYEPRRWMSGEGDDAGAQAWDVPLRRREAPAEPKADEQPEGLDER